MANQYSQPSGAISLVAATVKTALSIKTSASAPAELIELTVSLDHTMSAGECLVELVTCSSDGTGTAGTPNKYGISQVAVLSSTKINYTIEPTGIASTDTDAFYVGPQGLLVKEWPLGRELFVPISTIFLVRLTASATATARVTAVWEE